MAASGLLINRLALVTGGGSGIGRAVCEIFAANGAKIIAADIHEKNCEETINIINQQSVAHSSVKIDVANSKSIDSAKQFIKEKYSESPSIVVNCAGLIRDNFITKMSEEDFDEVINVNLKGTFLMTKVFGSLMIDSGIKNGSIINFGSIVGKVGNMGQCNYAAAKAGIINLTKTSAKEFAMHGIRCNVVLPGFIDTPMVKSVPERVIQKILPLIPMGRLGKPSEVAEVCLFLASDKSSFITGAELEVTGGMFM